jgi:uncharacterized protein (TIGR02145 family)
MKSILPIAVAIAVATTTSAGTLSGTLSDPDGNGRSGVVIRLSSSGDSATTAADGTWLIPTSAIDAVLPREGRGASITGGHLVLRAGRLGISLDGHDLQGRFQATTIARTATSAPRGLVDAAPDTLTYSWHGRTILRDTLWSLSQAGILRRFDTTLNPKIIHGYATDSRNGRIYRTVRIGSLEWTAENADYATDSSWCYGKTASNCLVSGRLYPWHAAMDLPVLFASSFWQGDTTIQQGACPAGWRVPTYTDWSSLYTSIGGLTGAGRLLKSAYQWSQVGVDSVGFHIVPTGYYTIGTGSFAQAGNYTFFWSSTELQETDASVWYFYSSSNGFYDTRDKGNGYSLRCTRAAE